MKKQFISDVHTNMQTMVDKKEEIVAYYKTLPDVEFEFSGLILDEAVGVIEENFNMIENYLGEI